MFRLAKNEYPMGTTEYFTADQFAGILQIGLDVRSEDRNGYRFFNLKDDEVKRMLLICMAIRNATKRKKKLDQLYILKGFHPSCEDVVGIKVPKKHQGRDCIGLFVLADLAERDHPHSSMYPVGEVIYPVQEDCLIPFGHQT